MAHQHADANHATMKALLIGAIAGTAATAAMTLVQNAATRLWRPMSRTDSPSDHKQTHQSTEPATVQAADAISRTVMRRNIADRHRDLAGQVMHYAFGAGVGAAYGVVAQRWPQVTTGRGAAFGTVVMLAADDIAVPLAGFSQAPTKTPLSTHVYALAAHLVYGMTAEQVRRTLHRLVSQQRHAAEDHLPADDEDRDIHDDMAYEARPDRPVAQVTP